MAGLAAAILVVVAATSVAAPAAKKVPPPKTPAAGSGSGSATDAGSAADQPTDNGGSGSPGFVAPPVDPATVPPADMPTAVRLRRIEEHVQELKEHAWQIKARVDLLKERTLGGGIGAQALIAHQNDMGSAFRLISLVYSLDGSQVFTRNEDTTPNLYKTKSFEIFAGPIAPGSHNIAGIAVYRGHGYGVFAYMKDFTFTVRGNQAFTAAEGKITKVDGVGHEAGNASVRMEKRGVLDFKVTDIEPEKPAGAPTMATPAATQTPAATSATPATPSTGK